MSVPSACVYHPKTDPMWKTWHLYLLLKNEMDLLGKTDVLKQESEKTFWKKTKRFLETESVMYLHRIYPNSLVLSKKQQKPSTNICSTNIQGTFVVDSPDPCDTDIEWAYVHHQHRYITLTPRAVFGSQEVQALELCS